MAGSEITCSRIPFISKSRYSKIKVLESQSVVFRGCDGWRELTVKGPGVFWGVTEMPYILTVEILMCLDAFIKAHQLYSQSQ